MGLQSNLAAATHKKPQYWEQLYEVEMARTRGPSTLPFESRTNLRTTTTPFALRVCRPLFGMQWSYWSRTKKKKWLDTQRKGNKQADLTKYDNPVNKQFLSALRTAVSLPLALECIASVQKGELAIKDAKQWLQTNKSMTTLLVVIGAH
eukprot:g61158.t1